MPYAEILPPPGVVLEGDEYTSGPHWQDTEKVRFDFGLPEKIGGWTKYHDTPVVGKCRELHSWRKLDATVPLAAGTHNYLYVYEGGTQYEVTPLRVSGTSLTTTPFVSGTAGSTTVTVTDSSHGAIDGDLVIFHFATGTTKVFDGITITEDQTYIITYVTDNSYTIAATSGTAASGSVTNGAAGAVTADYTINSGLPITVFGPGWGAGPFGDSTWGTARSASSIALASRHWSIDHWGEDLVAGYNGGTIYQWDVSGGSAGTRLTAISGVPSSIGFMTVSPDRHMITFGSHDGSAYDPLLIRWCDQGDNTTWTAAAANTAGSKRIHSGSKITSFSKAQRQTLIFTDVDAWGMQWVGPPFTFAFQQLGTNCGCVSPKGSVSMGSVTYWLGQNNFYMFDGMVRAIPCGIRDFFFSDLNQEQAELVYAALNIKYDEIWWFYPSGTNEEVDKYVIYNVRLKVWYKGTLDRLAWTDTDLNANPVAVDASGQIYYQEDGVNDVEDGITAYCETGAFEPENGNSMLFLDEVIPAAKDLSGNMTFTIYAKQYPNSTERSKSRTVTSSSTKIRPRMRGRQFRFKWESTDADNTWTLGKYRVNLQKDGGR